MFKINHKKAQAATELAVFGAILIFLIGAIVRTAVSSSYTQDQNFKAMRMAMLASWQNSEAAKGQGASPDTSHNSPSILFVEDRLSPDYNKYGDLDRNPFIAQGSGTFSYELLYPLSQASDVIAGLPIMDVYINGVYFPFTMASYISNKAMVPPPLSQCQADQPYSCQANQCYRNLREWVGGVIKVSAFEANNPPLAPITETTAALRETQAQANGCVIMNDLAQAGIFSVSSNQENLCASPAGGVISTQIPSPLADSPQWSRFMGIYEASFPGSTVAEYNRYFQAIQEILQGGQAKYKLFYNMAVNMGGQNSPTPAGGIAPLPFVTTPPTCTSHPCKDNELSSDATLLDYTGNATTDGDGSSTNSNGVMQYDLLRNADYSTSTGVLSQFPGPNGCINCMRNYAAWQWSATAGTTAEMIGLNADNNQYPSYDIDGRLKEVTIYGISQTSGITYLNYEDPQGGDIDGSWDSNSCGAKPGLEPSSQIYTFTQDGTYLKINEGKLYNPETGQVVRSANKRDTIDLIERRIQLSNDTYRFCGVNNTVLSCVGAVCPACTGANCPQSTEYGDTNCAASAMTCPANAAANPVEACEDESTKTSNCFTPSTIAETCYDTAQNVIFVRSRLQDRRGRFWMTNASGQLKVQ